MQINIYYGGRGLVDDPTLYVINKMTEVLEELRVVVVRYNLHEMKSSITTLPATIKDADGVILASTVEWHGIGGYMHQFLDACWLYGDKDKISKTYMCPIVMSTTYGEREGKLDLSVAWEILGGLPCSGICGYIADTLSLEMNKDYSNIIEKKAENMYRTINQRLASLPASNQAIKQMVSVTKNTDLSPQESEQLSQYAADDTYVQTQKEDIKELANMFKGMLAHQEINTDERKDVYIDAFERTFRPVAGFKASYQIQIKGIDQKLIINIDASRFSCFYGAATEKVDVELQITPEGLKAIFSGDKTFQTTFMTGGMRAKGDFELMRALDKVFPFKLR